MRVRRLLLTIVAVLTGMAGFQPASADLPGSKPPLKTDTRWVETSWGYADKDLTFPATNPIGEKWPTLMVTEAYGGAGTPNAYIRMDDGELMALRFEFGGGNKEYLRLRASVRGSECSGGGYNLYDRRHAWDGHHIIEWVADQPWSNGSVGLHGSSLSGQTAYWIATTQPPSLKAVSANLLHSDIYRDIFMVGGVQNYLFPTAWTYGTGPHRLPTDAADNGTLQNDEICQWNQTQRYNPFDLPQPENEPAWAALRSVDDDWYHAHAALTYASAIKIPYYQQSNWQDEQVGPRGMILWNHIDPDPKTIIDKNGQSKTVIPKKLVSSSGDHGWGQFHNRDLYKWLDIWLRDKADVAGVTDHLHETYFETRGDPAGSPYTAAKYGDAWPFADTTFVKSYLRQNNGMSFDAASVGQQEASDTFISGVPRQGWFWYAANTGAQVTTARGYPDAVHYLSGAVGQDPSIPTDSKGNFTIAGPIMMNLWASMAGADADFFVSVSDVYPNGSVNYLQRGWLKASHKAVDPVRSYYAADDKTMVIPYMSHSNPQPVEPGALNEYQIEIFPLGHIFRPGHKILVQIHTPPAVDGLWGYTPTHPPAAVTIVHDAAHPSWIQWPMVEADEWTNVAPFTGCKVPGGFPCNPASPFNR